MSIFENGFKKGAVQKNGWSFTSGMIFDHVFVDGIEYLSGKLLPGWLGFSKEEALKIKDQRILKEIREHAIEKIKHLTGIVAGIAPNEGWSEYLAKVIHATNADCADIRISADEIVYKFKGDGELGGKDCDRSHREAVEIARTKASWSVIDEKEIRAYAGRVLGVTSHHVVQSLGKIAVIHHKANLDRIPETNEVLNVNYNDGRGKVCPAVKASVANDLAR